MKRTIWILGDQLTHRHSALGQADKESTTVLLIESRAQGAHLRYHKIKLAMIYSAMRHFAEELGGLGWKVDYHSLEETADFSEGVRRHLKNGLPNEFVVMEPNSLEERQTVERIIGNVGRLICWTQPVQFLREREDFLQWARGKKRLLMEHHYRTMRERLGILMTPEGEPEGGKWNLDAENRHGLREWKQAGVKAPVTPRSQHDAITKSAIKDVERFFPDAPGRASDLWLPVTRKEALVALEDFVTHRLGHFGDFEDLMIAEEPRLFHSLLSAPINIGLLDPLECVQAAVKSYHQGKAPLNAVEGFVRQIIGWREFINGVYWLKMPAYADANALHAQRPLPGFFYTGETSMRCLSTVLKETLASGYNHHIERLMVLGNFLLLAGVRPQEALRWFSELYVDAFEWVMAANVLGMSLHADGGFMATKPYAASAAYISKMSNYCEGCAYKPTIKVGPRACPYNLLYWDFYNRHADRFETNPRTAVMVKAWKKRDTKEKSLICQEAQEFLARLDS